jgi:hypothetical protein
MPSSYQFIDALLFLFDYSDTMRPAYVVVVAIAVLMGVLAYQKFPSLRITTKRAFWRRLSGLAAVTALALGAFLALQDHKLLHFDADDVRCDTSSATVLYLPMWVDRTLDPYLGETYQQYSSTCEDLRDRISSAPLGWSRHVTLGAHLALSLILTALLSFVVANIASLIKRGGLSDG